MTVGIYIRVSTEEQVKEGYSISAQRERLKAYCVAQGWDDYKYYVDEGISAKDTERPQLKKLLKHIEEGKIKNVLVYRLDRLTRSVLDLYKLLDTFDKYECTFKSATEIYDTSSAMGRLFITLVAALAQWERENLGERVRMGQIEKARQGEYAAKAPFGFNKNENDKLYINKEEEKIIRMMKEKIEEGYSIRRLSNHMNGLSIPPIRGYKWHIGTILDILQNPALYGAIKWSDVVYEGCHEGIFTKGEFEKLQNLISSRQNFKKRETYSIFIYQMKLKCPTCGNRLTCERSKYHRKRDDKIVETNHYRCQVCVLNKRKAVMVSELRMEKGFVEYMESLKLDNIPKVENETNDERKDLMQKIEKIERQREKYQKAWANDLVTDEEFTERMNETKTTLNTLLEKFENLKPKKQVEYNPDKIKDIVNKFKLNWSHLTPIEKKEFMSNFIESIEFEKEGINAKVNAVNFY